MRIPKFYISMLFLMLLLVVGCSNAHDTDQIEVSTFTNPTAEEVLTLDPEADIFQFDGVIYQTGIDWVEEEELTKNEQVGEITAVNTEKTIFEDNMANTLPVGAKIFSAVGEEGTFLLVESGGVMLKYYAIVEG